MSRTRILNRANEHSSTAPLLVDGPFFNELVALLAEILALDYQEHKQITVSSPPRSDRKT